MVPASVAAHSLSDFLVMAAMGLSAKGITTMANVSADRNHVGAFHSSACIGNHACDRSDGQANQQLPVKPQALGFSAKLIRAL